MSELVQELSAAIRALAKGTTSPAARRVRTLCDQLEKEIRLHQAVETIEAGEVKHVLPAVLEVFLKSARASSGAITLDLGRGRVSRGAVPETQMTTVPLIFGDEPLGTLGADVKASEMTALKPLVSRLAEIIYKSLLLEDARRLLPPPPLRALIGHSPAFRKAIQAVEHAAGSDVPLIFCGEPGTGKTALARAAHELSPRRAQPFTIVDAALALPASIPDGTLFVKDVEHLSQNVPKGVRLMGSTRLASPPRLQNAAVISLPPLRERREDLPNLLFHFLRESARRHRKNLTGFDRPALERLLRHTYPGNLPELQAIVERSVALADGPLIQRSDLPEELGPQSIVRAAAPRSAQELRRAKREARDQIERQFLIDSLRRSGGKVTQAAQDTGVHRTRLAQLVARFKIKLSDFRPGA
jgi:transcriptional regulator with PAS, ATPase and Fis domain